MENAIVIGAVEVGLELASLRAVEGGSSNRRLIRMENHFRPASQWILVSDSFFDRFWESASVVSAGSTPKPQRVVPECNFLITYVLH